MAAPSSHAAGQDLEGSEAEVSFPSGDLRLVGTLALPSGEGPVPAVVLLSGSGPRGREGDTPGFVPEYRPSQVLAEPLVEAGIASLRYDERGVGGSAGSHSAASTTDLADDVEPGLMYLSSVDRIDSESVGLLGQKEGASIAARVAARTGKVAFVVGLAGPAVSGHQLVIAQSEHALRDSGLQGQALEEAMAGVRAEYALVIRGEWEAIEAAIRQVLPAQLEALPPGQRARLRTLEEIIAEEMTRLKHWTQFFLVHDPAEDWSRIQAPVLVLLGGLDVQVTVEQDRGPLEDALAVAPADDWTVRVFPKSESPLPAGRDRQPGGVPPARSGGAPRDLALDPRADRRCGTPVMTSVDCK